MLRTGDRHLGEMGLRSQARWEAVRCALWGARVEQSRTAAVDRWMAVECRDQPYLLGFSIQIAVALALRQAVCAAAPAMLSDANSTRRPAPGGKAGHLPQHAYIRVFRQQLTLLSM